MILRAVSGIVFALGTSALVAGQEYTWEPVTAANVEVRVHKKLQGVPVELGNAGNVIGRHQVARFDPRANQAIMKGPQPFKWGMDVYEFGPPPPKYTDKPTDQDEIRRRAIEKRDFEAGARNYEDFLKNKDPRNTQATFHNRGGGDGLLVKARGGTPEHRYYEYSIPAKTDDPVIDFHWYSVSAAYRLGDREVALVFTWPIFKDKPDAKYLDIAKKMVQALRVVEAPAEASGALSGDDSRNQHADTPARQQKLETAVANIRGIDGWDYYTTPAGIVLYSWKPGSNKRDKALADSQQAAECLAELPALFAERFPAPENAPEFYPVLRLCFDRALFRNYGRPPLRSLGMFNPESGEIVIEQGGAWSDTALTARYGFECYASTIYNTPSPGPWLVNGFGDWYAAHERQGKRWAFEPIKERVQGPKSARDLVKSGRFASIREVLGWNDAKLAPDEENEDAELWLAQTYTLADFLMRGEKLGSKWNAEWADLLPAYCTELAKTRNASRAAKVFDTVDAAAFDAAWQEWAESYAQRK